MSPHGTCWPEKYFFDAFKDHQHNWTNDLGFDSQTLEWVHEERAQTNLKGYSIRLFVIRLTTRPDVNTLYRLSREIYKCVNSMKGNTSTLHIHKKSFLWKTYPTCSPSLTQFWPGWAVGRSRGKQSVFLFSIGSEVFHFVFQWLRFFNTCATEIH